MSTLTRDCLTYFIQVFISSEIIIRKSPTKYSHLMKHKKDEQCVLLFKEIQFQLCVQSSMAGWPSRAPWAARLLRVPITVQLQKSKTFTCVFGAKWLQRF